MSGRVVGRVFERKLGSNTHKSVLLCLAEHANPDGEMSFPSVNRISQETELGESTVRKSLAWLRLHRLIEITAGWSQHRPATYRVCLETLPAFPLVEVYHREVYEGASRPLGDTAQAFTAEQPDLSVVAPNRPRTVHEPSQQPSVLLQAKDQGTAQMVDAWHKSIGPITGGIAEDLCDLAHEADEHIARLPAGAAGADKSGTDWVVAAIREARMSATGRPNGKYIQRVLDRWMAVGFMAPLLERPVRRGKINRDEADKAILERMKHGNS